MTSIVLCIADIARDIANIARDIANIARSIDKVSTIGIALEVGGHPQIC